MFKKKVFSKVLAVLGVAILALGIYVSNEAIQGEKQISEAEANEAGGRRPVLGPLRRGIRSSESQSAQERINQKWQQVMESKMTAYWLEGIGVILFILGIGYCILSHKKQD
jgi:hypothetical protein